VLPALVVAAVSTEDEVVPGTHQPEEKNKGIE